MTQITIRSSEELIERVKAAARGDGRSMNEWVIFVLEAATNPAPINDKTDRLLERLRQAGVLHGPTRRPGPRPSSAAVAKASTYNSGGTLLSDLVTEDRGE